MANNFTERIESYVLSIIEGRQKDPWAAIVSAMLYHLSLLFGMVVQLRLWLYEHGIFRIHALGCQVLSVGNLTVGGTGKTPVVEVFARRLHERGRKVAILSRGYKKTQPSLMTCLRTMFSPKVRGPLVVSDGDRILIDSAAGGDEPYMLASNLKGVAVLVDSNRVKSGCYAIQKLKCDTLILDDGFHHLELQHRLDIVLVDRTNPFGNSQLLPRGILREPIRNIKRAGFIFVTKSTLDDGAEKLKRQLREYNPTAEISECRHCSRYLQNVFTREQLPRERLQGLRVCALSGIASPKSFEDDLVRLGATVLHHRIYADHHRYSQQELMDEINEGLNRGAVAILTTEKDAVRFPMLERTDLPVYFLRVEIEMISGADAFDEWISRICFHQ